MNVWSVSGSSLTWYYLALIARYTLRVVVFMAICCIKKLVIL